MFIRSNILYWTGSAKTGLITFQLLELTPCLVIIILLMTYYYCLVQYESVSFKI